MPWRIEYDEQRNVICLTFEGQVSGEDVRHSSISAIGIIEGKDMRNILSDFTGVARIDVSTLGVFQLPKEYKALGLRGWFREAIVSPRDSMVRETVVFYETVCVNRGYSVRTFERRAQALDWLASTEALHPTQKPRGWERR